MLFFKLLLSIAVFCAIPRIERKGTGPDQVGVIYLSQGLVSIVEFPNPILEVIPGNPKLVKAVISNVAPRQVTVWLAEATSAPTNFIVRTEKRVFVFDILPKQSVHQDYIRVSGFSAVNGSETTLQALSLSMSKPVSAKSNWTERTEVSP